jgi:hypothetical protein
LIGKGGVRRAVEVALGEYPPKHMFGEKAPLPGAAQKCDCLLSFQMGSINKTRLDHTQRRSYARLGPQV